MICLLFCLNHEYNNMFENTSLVVLRYACVQHNNVVLPRVLFKDIFLYSILTKYYVDASRNSNNWGSIINNKNYYYD